MVVRKHKRLISVHPAWTWDQALQIYEVQKDEERKSGPTHATDTQKQRMARKVEKKKATTDAPFLDLQIALNHIYIY